MDGEGEELADEREGGGEGMRKDIAKVQHVFYVPLH